MWYHSFNVTAGAQKKFMCAAGKQAGGCRKHDGFLQYREQAGKRLPGLRPLARWLLSM
ncbi:MAG: hypothetical protein LKG42_05275 [Eubacterium sp.]|nr:hypothetical protein [Eubacterium sp.]MCH4046494.1 hypothetical protein [Eubacterium sp.]MCH4079589.1 hypothetical protein [Eubacterium sp.]MCH4110148.1 hypothetical protein [Eubacterium sp.]MCI1307410.1 hypothetical protein [Eubacterium sp.]